MTRRYDAVIAEIADYACAEGSVASDEALRTARLCLMDSIGCAFLALNFPACTKLLGPEVSGSQERNGSRVLGTPFRLAPSKAAFDTTALIRWLDFNDTWLAKEWGHPSDNFGALLAISDHLSRSAVNGGQVSEIRIRDLLELATRAYEIQGILALGNAFNAVGIDHVLLVKVASAAVSAAMLSGNDREIVASAVSHSWLDATLRTYRHSPNTGSRKSWAAGDAASRAVRIAQMASQGEPGCHTALTAEGWGFQDAWFDGDEVTLDQELGCYVMENVLFKISFPAEFHGQTAVEAAMQLHPEVKSRLDEIFTVNIRTQEAGKRIIDKSGALQNPADRDHCIQYMTAVALIDGDLTADSYEDEAASDPRIDDFRSKMFVEEDPTYSTEYLDPESRSIANSVQVFFDDGSSTEDVEVRYPLGHRRRRNEALPLLMSKFRANIETRLDEEDTDRLTDLFESEDVLDEMPMDDFMSLLAQPTE